MTDFSSSDSDFWDNFSEVPNFCPSSKARPIEIPIVPDNQPKITAKKLREWDIDKQEKAITRIKNASIEEINIEGIRVKNITKKELFPAVKEIVASFKREIDSISQNSFKMKEKKLVINRDQLHLLKKMCVQDRLLTRFNIGEINLITDQEFYEESSVVKELKILQPQLACLREVAAEHNKDFLVANEKIAKVKLEMSQLKYNHEVKIANLKSFYEDKEEKANEEAFILSQGLRNLKEKSGKELEILCIIHQRQQEFIHKLYEELANSKYIFNNPRLRQLLHVKFRTKTENIEEPTSSYSKKRSGVSTRATKYSDIEEKNGSRPVTRDFRSTVTPKLSEIKEIRDSSEFFKVKYQNRSKTPYK